MTNGNKPNILFVMADQLSALATSPYRNEDVLTPNLSELARRGVVFEKSYCNSPLCAPSRASMMTGQLASRIPVNDNSEELPASVPTFVHHLRRGGYKTILSGKMHFVGPDQLHGFEERLTTDIYPSDFLWHRYWPAQGDPPRRVGLPGDAEAAKIYERQMSQCVKEAGPVTWSYQLAYDEEVHFHALERLRCLLHRQGASARQPWFLCVSYTQPHDPYVSTFEYWNRYDGVDFAMPQALPSNHEPHPFDVWVNSYHGLDLVDPMPKDVYRARRGYYAMTSYIDDKLGELIGELKRFGQAQNTVIIFTSDHGDMVGELGMWHKRTLREWSTRVPLLIAGPEIAKNSRVVKNVSLVDLYPTLVELAGQEIPEAEFVQDLDGNSIVPFLRGGSPAGWQNEVIVENNGEGTIKPVRGLIKDQFKFVHVHEKHDQLFDLAYDPDELRNVANDPSHQKVAMQFRSRLLGDWDPAETERSVLASQRRRLFLKEALYQGIYTPWDYQPVFDASGRWLRRTPNTGTVLL